MSLSIQSQFVYVVEVYNNQTLEHEVIAYLRECSDERRRVLEDMFENSLKDDEDYSLRIYTFNGDFDNTEIVMEALNFVRE